MRKAKIWSILLVATLILSVFCIPASAETAVDFSSDFSDYIGTWNGTTVTDTAVFPTIPGGAVANYNAIKPFNGVTSGTPTDSPYGTSVKIHQKYSAEDTAKIYGGFKYTLSGGNSVDDSVYFESSVYTEPNADKLYITKSIEFRNYGTGRTGAAIRPVLFSGSYIQTYGETTSVPYEGGRWLDFKIWTNLTTGDFKTQIWSEGEMLDEVTGTTDVSTLGKSMTQIIFMHRVYSGYTNNWKYDEDGNPYDQITYVDNFRLQEAYGFENPEPDALAAFDFNDYTNTTDIKTGPSNGVWGTWKWGYANSKTHGIFAEETDRGTSLRFENPVYEGETDSTGAPADTTLPNGNLTLNQLKYPAVYYDLNDTYKVTEGAAYLKTSVMLGDLNFNSARVAMGGVNVFYLTPNLENEYSDGDIKIFGDEASIDTGLNLKLNNWYDIETTLDISTGYIEISIDDGKEKYEYSGYVPESTYAPGTEISRLQYISWNRTPHHDWSKPTSMLIDDVKFGGIGEIYVPDGTEYEFLIDKRLTTTGFDKVINMTDDVVVSFTNEIDTSAFNASVNGTAVSEDDIVFVDGRTVRLDFPKTQNASYKVDMTDIEDVYGNTLTDYIIFSTEAQDMYISGVSYTRDGEVLKKTSPGKAAVFFEGAEYSGDGTEIYFTAGVFRDGRLISASKDIFEMTAEETEYSLEVTIPDDTNYYVIKTFIWNAATLEPLADMSMLTATQDGLPVALVKLDVLEPTEELFTMYEDIKVFLEEEEIKAAVGFVSRRLDSDFTDEELVDVGARVRNYYDSDYIEMWDHQYSPLITCDTATYEEQLGNLNNATAAMSKIGMEYRVWGPTNNACNEYTAAALNASPNYELVIIRKTMKQLNAVGMLDESNNFKVLYEWMPVETGATDAASGSLYTVPRHIEEIQADWEAAIYDRSPYLLLQWHPNTNGTVITDSDGVVWGGEGNTMLDGISWFKEQGATFMTPLEYIEYLKNF